VLATFEVQGFLGRAGDLPAAGVRPEQSGGPDVGPGETKRFLVDFALDDLEAGRTYRGAILVRTPFERRISVVLHVHQ
jgi:hypothetical protein